jgi:hypothetical protein
MLRGFLFMACRHGLMNHRFRSEPFLIPVYDALQKLWRGIPYPRKWGKIPVGQRTPAAEYDLQAGDWVRVKSYDEIRATCDQANKNRGMIFDAEMVPYCGGTYQVLRRVTTMVNEKTGELQQLKNPCFILDGVSCQSRYSECRLFCPRSIYSYWRAIWLEKVPAPAHVGTKLEAATTLEAVRS